MSWSADGRTLRSAWGTGDRSYEPAWFFMRLRRSFSDSLRKRTSLLPTRQSELPDSTTPRISEVQGNGGTVGSRSFLRGLSFRANGLRAGRKGSEYERWVLAYRAYSMAFESLQVCAEATFRHALRRNRDDLKAAAESASAFLRASALVDSAWPGSRGEEAGEYVISLRLKGRPVSIRGIGVGIGVREWSDPPVIGQPMSRRNAVELMERLSHTIDSQPDARISVGSSISVRTQPHPHR